MPPQPALRGPPVSAFSFRFTQDIREALNKSLAQDGASPQPEPRLDSVPLNTVDEDLEDVLFNHGVSGKVGHTLLVRCANSHQAKGQNEMSQDWLKGCAQQYLDRILLRETVEDLPALCQDCNAPSPTFVCRDCLNNLLLCSACIRERHQYFPCHRFREWKGHHFVDCDSSQLGIILHLGHGGHECNLGKTCTFTLGDITGIHTLNIRFCRHPGSADSPRQLLDAQIFPCSDKRPKSGFTFTLLRKFHYLGTEAKLSSQRYYNVLVCQTNAAFPSQVPDRYREFMRTARQWDHLQDLKRAGTVDVMKLPDHPGDLALRCPACPREGVNFYIQDVKDGNQCVKTLGTAAAEPINL